MNYQAIGFDYGGVINGRPAPTFTHDLCTLVGIDADTYKTAYFSHNASFNDGTITADELWELVLNDVGKSEKLPEVLELVKQRDRPQLNQNIVDLVDTLRANGLKVGLLSNNSHEAAARMRTQGLAEHFDAFDVSAETGLVKPNPAAFQHLADALDTPIESLIFIDDSERSLSTSDETGYTPVLYRSYDQLVDRLGELGVLD